MALEDAWGFLKQDWCPECAGSGWSLDGQHCDYCDAEPVEVPTATNENVPQELTPETEAYLRRTPPKMGRGDLLSPLPKERPPWKGKMDEWRENKRERLRGRDE